MGYVGLQDVYQCFNSHKNFQLGWYQDKTISVDPSIVGTWTGSLAAFIGYSRARENEVVFIKVRDLYLQYNQKDSFN